MVVATSAVTSPILSVSHTIVDADYPSPTGSAATYSVEPLTVSYLPATVRLTNPDNLTLLARPVRVNYGSPTVDARASVAATGVQVDVGGAADAANQVYGDLSWVRAGTNSKAPVLRMEGRSLSLHGPIGAQASLLVGSTVYLQKYHAAPPALGPAAAYVAVTKPGAGFGSDNGAAAATTYANDAAFAAVGYAGPVGGAHGRGWNVGFQAGGTASAAMTSSETSALGTGFYARDVEVAGLTLTSPLSASGLLPKGVAFANDSAGRAWDWLLHFDNATANAPTTGALMLPGANGMAGQVRWGSDSNAPYLFRQADQTAELRGILRVVHGGGVTDPQVLVTGLNASDSPAFVAQSGGGAVKLAIPGVNDTFLSGAVAGDTVLLITSTRTLRFGSDANQTLGVLAPGPKWGFGTAAPTDGFHSTLGARFSGTYTASAITATNAGVYLGVDTNAKVALVTGVTGQRKWEVQNVAGVLTLSEPGTTHATLSNSTLTLPLKVIAQTGSGTNTFAGGIQVDGATRLATSLTGLLKAIAGAVTTAVAGVDYESALGNPGTSGFVLSSTTGGVRSWVAQSGGALNTATFVTMATESTLPNSVALGAGVNMAGLLAALPSSGFVAGRTYLATNDRGGTLYRDSGSAMVQAAASVTHAAAHLPGGVDPLVTASAVGLADVNAAGSGAAFALATHTHKRDVKVAAAGSVAGTRNRINFTFLSGSNSVTDDAANDQVTVNIVPAAGATPVSSTVTALTDTAGGVVGASGTYADGAHAHERSVRVALSGTDVGTQNRINFTTNAGSFTVTNDAAGRQVTINVPPPGSTTAAATVTNLDGTAAVGTGTNFAREDHKHGIANAAITNGMLVNASLTVTAGTGLAWASGAGLIALGAASPALNLANTAVAAGSYTVASITVDAQGRLTAASSGTTAAPVSIGTANAAGSGTALALANHVHRGAVPVSVGGTPVSGTARTIINFAAGAGIGLSGTDNSPGADQVTVTITNTAVAAPVGAAYVTLTSDATLTNETLFSALVSSGLHSARPAFGTAGRTYLETDTFGGTPFFDTGAAWLQQAHGVQEPPVGHVASHQPGGTDALTTGTPVALGDTFAAGSGTALSLANHVHKLAVRVRVSGVDIGSTARRAINLVPGSGITLQSTDDSTNDQTSITITNAAQQAPTDASYVTMAAEASLTNETVLGAGVLMAGTLSGRPAPAVAGPFHLTTDTNGGTLYRWSGSGWVQAAPGVTQAPQFHVSTHYPGGTDPLPTAIPVLFGNALGAGSGTNLALANHVHKRDVRVAIAGADVSTPTVRNRINFAATNGLSLAGADDSANDQSTVTVGINAAGIANDRLANPGLTITTAAGSGLTGGSVVQAALGSTVALAIGTGAVTNAMLANPSVTVTAGPGLSGGGLVNLGAAITLSIGGGQVTNGMLANPATTLTAGTGLTWASGTGLLTLGAASPALNLANTAVAPGSYTHANLTVDAQGRLTAANSNAVNLASAEVTGLLPLANGGTNASTAATARANLGAAASGTNLDILSLAGLNTQAAIQVNPWGAAAGNTGEARFLELAANGTNYTGFKAPDTLAGNLLYVLPAAPPTAGQSLTSDVNGVLAWATPTAGTITSIGPGTGQPTVDVSGLTFTPSPIQSGAGQIALSRTGVTAGSYTNANISVDAQGRISTASNGAGSSLVEASASAPWDPPSIAIGAGWSQDFAVAGAAVGDVVALSFNTTLPDGMFLAAQGPTTGGGVPVGTVRVQLFNGTGSAQDLAAGTLQFYCRHLSGTAGTTSMLVGTLAWDPPSMAAGQMEDAVIPVSGAVVGSSCKVSFSLPLPAGLWLSEQVDVAGQVTATFWNATNAPVDLASGLLTARVWL